MWTYTGVAVGLRLALRANRERLLAWSRQFGNKAKEGKPTEDSGSVTPARPGPGPEPEPAGRPAFKLPGHKPSGFDKKMLVWSGRFRREEDIPTVVSIEMIDAARNRMRVKASYIMVVMTVVACIATIISGKKAARRNESLTAMNMEKKARWKKENEQEAKVTKSQ